MKKVKILLISLTAVLLLAACGGDVGSKSESGAFSVGSSNYETLQAAVDSLPSSKAASANYTITLNRDVTDSGAVISDISAEIKLDFGSYVYTLANSSKGITIDGSSAGIEISGGTIKVGSGNTVDSVFSSKSNIVISGLKMDISSSDLNAIETAGTAKLTVQEGSAVKTAESKNAFVVKENASVSVVSASVDGGISLSAAAVLTVESGTVNVSRIEAEAGAEITIKKDAAVTASSESDTAVINSHLSDESEKAETAEFDTKAADKLISHFGEIVDTVKNDFLEHPVNFNSLEFSGAFDITGGNVTYERREYIGAEMQAYTYSLSDLKGSLAEDGPSGTFKINDTEVSFKLVNGAWVITSDDVEYKYNEDPSAYDKNQEYYRFASILGFYLQNAVYSAKSASVAFGDSGVKAVVDGTVNISTKESETETEITGTALSVKVTAEGFGVTAELALTDIKFVYADQREKYTEYNDNDEAIWAGVRSVASSYSLSGKLSLDASYKDGTKISFTADFSDGVKEDETRTYKIGEYGFTGKFSGKIGVSAGVSTEDSGSAKYEGTITLNFTNSDSLNTGNDDVVGALADYGIIIDTQTAELNGESVAGKRFLNGIVEAINNKYLIKPIPAYGTDN